MRRSFVTAALCLVGLVVGSLTGAGSLVSRAHADLSQQPAAARSEAPPPYDPKKKNDGESCKTSAECQPHSTCTKVGDKSVCQAPPRPQLPPGAVT